MTQDAIVEILSEAAVEIENLDSRANVVAQRIRRAMAELRDPHYWERRVANLGRQVENFAMDLAEVAAGRVPKRRVKEVCD